MLKICYVCNKTHPIKKMVKKTKVITKTGFASAGCSIRSFYFCSTCAPSKDVNLPNSKTRFVVGKIIKL